MQDYIRDRPRESSDWHWLMACSPASAMDSNRPIRVLIVDDSGADRLLCKQCLRRSPSWEFEFAEASSAAAGIDLTQGWRPDCILLDHDLPDADGIEVLSRLGSKPEGLPCASVMLTACGAEEFAVRAMQAGASACLPKGLLATDALPHAVVSAIERFRMKQEIDQQHRESSISERRYGILLEAIPQMVFAATTEGRLEYANRRWLEYTGLSLEHAGNLGWDRLLHPDDRARSWSAWNQARRSGAAFDIQHRIRRASDGSYQWHMLRAVPLRNAAGELTSWLGTCTEIEEHKQAENAAFEEQIRNGISRLASGVAHDFNNLLVCILGGASRAMQSLPASHPAQEMLEDVVHAGEQLAQLTHRMLAYAGKAMFRVGPVNVQQLVRDACESVRPSIPGSVRLDVRSGPVPPVRTDSAYLRQAIVDLVWNAVEAIGPGSSGGITVHTQLIEIGEEFLQSCGFGPAAVAGEYVAVEVRDTGCGMDEETRHKIFDPFFSTKFLGRGLSLAAVRGFLSSTGGGLQVHSRPGMGSAFQVLLPVATAEKSASGVEAEPPPSRIERGVGEAGVQGL